MFKKSNKIGKKDNFGKKSKYISLLKKGLFFFIKINLKERNQKTCNFLLKINLSICQKKFFFEKNKQCRCSTEKNKYVKKITKNFFYED